MTEQARGLKIIGAGFGRTGTLSLKAALEELGFGPCYHMTEVFHHPEHVAYWRAAANGEPVDWHKLFDGYQATVDWPACTFYKELMQAFPDARVLLTVRDPQSWYESASSTIYNVRARDNRSLPTALRRTILRLFFPAIRQMVQVNDALIWQGTFDGRFEDRQYAISVFQKHIEEVKRTVPPERLLVYDIKQGWEPLCTFLDVPVPDKPFPRLNDRASFAGTRNLRRLQTRLVATALIALASSLLAAFFFLSHRSKHAK
jgi:hypothetical protein